jgi:hypothetical protein
MKFRIKFCGPHSNAVQIHSFKPGLKFLDEARVRLDHEIDSITNTATYRTDWEILIKEETARRCGTLFENEGEARIDVAPGKLNKYAIPQYSHQSDDWRIAKIESWDIDEERLIEDFILAGCPREWK